MFASRLNKQLPLLCSRRADPEAWGVDALSLPWHNIKFGEVSTESTRSRGLSSPVEMPPLSRLACVRQALTGAGVFNRRPPRPRYLVTWDVNKVLTYLESFAPSRSLAIRDLTLKVTALMALTCTDRTEKAVGSATLGRWLKLVMKEAGIDTSIFKPHSHRGAATSAALDNYSYPSIVRIYVPPQFFPIPVFAEVNLSSLHMRENETEAEWGILVGGAAISCSQGGGEERERRTQGSLK
ncbi:hypothetical protein Bbelb_382880 [Branchiostoma belcheri]|nr:hypothetical protein Bbelb_382880 [Branchiostoma belcheri]